MSDMFKEYTKKELEDLDFINVKFKNRVYPAIINKEFSKEMIRIAGGNIGLGKFAVKLNGELVVSAGVAPLYINQGQEIEIEEWDGQF